MGDMYDYDKNTCSSSTSAAPPSSSSQDDISLFLNQILIRSSSPAHVGKNAQSLMSSTTIAGLCNKNATLGNAQSSYRSSLPGDGIFAVDSIARPGVNTSSGVLLSSSGIYSSANIKGSSAANVSSSSVGVSENETDEYDCESEEGIDALADEVLTKSVPPRSSSKRSRAAEVHNLSEKRRRSRINEKMKALQNLIPNSNKTDKASMLDEAIEYLKQLQLQVQMLAMRNGSSLHPMCFPEGLQPLQLSRMRMEFDEENRSTPLNMAATLPLHYGRGLPNKRTVADQPSVLSPSYIMNSEASFGSEPPFLGHLGPFHLKRPSEEICREDILQHQQLNANHSDNNLSGVSQGFESGSLATVSVSFDMQPYELRDNVSLETCISGRDQSGAVLRNIEHNHLFSSQLQMGEIACNDNFKTEKPDFLCLP
ncbi:hypothetical protein L6164_019896 [Bauhinia variegata]|uniref:Uncharacterized protein n=1 Tax=Bauhinia variegata TaxID=167791 RepID=A0ACB9MTK6_BAUVA|nr:hypothetical protein L6164_019896 [Bauhinia variegata]